MSNLHRTVSSESEELILVDRDDREIGYQSKAMCHDGDGMLHRAFSLFLFNDRGERGQTTLAGVLVEQLLQSSASWRDPGCRDPAPPG